MGLINKVDMVCLSPVGYGVYLFSFFSLSEEEHCYRFPQLQQALLFRFVVEEVTVHNTGISLLLSKSVWVLLSPR